MEPFMCMAIAIFFEAQGESFDGKLAVGQVIENRVESSHFPDNVCDVVFQRKQFSFTHDGLSDNPEKHIKNDIDRTAWDESQQAAQEVMMLDIKITDATHYHATYVNPYWTDAYEVVDTIGEHVFYS